MIVRILARALTGTAYLSLGVDTARDPGGRVGLAAPTLNTMRRFAPLPSDETTVRINGAVQAVAGGLLALGVYPRAAALVLLGSVVPTTIAGHGFWNIDDPAARKLQWIQFRKNVAMAGGLVYELVPRTASIAGDEPASELQRRCRRRFGGA